MADRNAAGIGPGARVRMHYEIRLEDGTVADSSFGGEPLEFTVGDGTLVEGLEQAIAGLRPGERRTLSIGPEQAFGYRVDDYIHELPRGDFPPDMRLAPGLIVSFATPGGEEIPGAILEVGEETVKVDFNHPLAGHELAFTVEVLEVRPASGGEGRA